MDNRPIGVFDSGLGGLTVVKELHRLLPNENIVYFGDTGRVPYGTRSKETIIKYAQQDISFLLSHNVKMIIAACGTVSSTLPAAISDAIGVPYLAVVLPAAQAACAMTQNERVGVIATTASIRSNAYGKAIRNIRPETHVFGNGCPLLVPLVEAGLIQKDNEITRLTVKMYLEPLMRENIDTLILGCTHYPLIYDIINEVLDYKVTLIDPGQQAARYTLSFLTENGMLTEEETGHTSYFVTDQVSGFFETASIFLGEDVGTDVQQVEIDML